MQPEFIDQALREIAPYIDGCADQIIDIRETVLNQGNPGTCVRCHFTMYGKAANAADDRLFPLRRWLERHIEVVARDEVGDEIERLPVVLGDDEDLQSYCEKMMAEFRDNRAYSHRRIGLSFRFREERLAA